MLSFGWSSSGASAFVGREAVTLYDSKRVWVWERFFVAWSQT